MSQDTEEMSLYADVSTIYEVATEFAMLTAATLHDVWQLVRTASKSEYFDGTFEIEMFVNGEGTGFATYYLTWQGIEVWKESGALVGMGDVFSTFFQLDHLQQVEEDKRVRLALAADRLRRDTELRRAQEAWYEGVAQ